jgi:hypothetical protein
MWQAVSRFDAELIQLPAFGASRLDEKCLAEMLPLLVVASPVRDEEEEKLQEESAAGRELLSLVLGTAEALLQSRNPLQGSFDKRPGEVPSGALLLQGILQCRALVIPSIIARALQIYVAHPGISPSEGFLLPAVCAAAKEDGPGALFQPDSVLSVTLQHAKALNIQIAGLAEVMCHAMAGADLGSGPEAGNNSVLEAQSQLLRRISALVEDTPWVRLLPEAAGATSTLLQRHPSAAEQLLFPEMPKSVLEATVQAAVDQKQPQALLQLLQHSQSQKQLQSFPVNLLQAAATSPLPHSAAAISAMEQLVSMLLQQGQKTPVAAAAFLLQEPEQASSHCHKQWQHLQQWLAAECRSAPSSAAFHFLLQLLDLSIMGTQQQVSRDQSWQLFELLLSCQEDWGPEQQGLPAAVADALIQQQGQGQVGTGDSAGRVVQVWKCFCRTTRDKVDMFQQLQLATQQHVVTALVKTGNDEQGVAIVWQVPQFLQVLAEEWQKKRRVEVRLLTSALQLAVKEDTELSAGAAVVLLGVMKRLQVEQEVLAGDLGAQVLKLLCKYNHIIPAAVLLPYCANSSDAVAVFFTSAAAQPVEQQHKALKELGAGVRSNPGVRDMMRASLINLMERKNFCALGLLWQALHDTSNGDDVVPVLQTLSETQQEQVLKLCFCSCPNPAAPSFTACCLADQMLLSSAELSAQSAAEWLSAIARDHEELQPCRAGVLLRVVTDKQLVGPGGSSSGTRVIREGSYTGNLATKADIDGSRKLMARLCFSPLGDTLSSMDVTEVQAAVDWVGRFLPETFTSEAAAAVLFAVWYSQQQQQQQQQEDGDALAVSPVAAGVMGLALYHAARKGSTLSAAAGWTAKPSLDSLVLDLALAAAVGAEQWEEGKACLLFLLFFARRVRFVCEKHTMQFDAVGSVGINEQWTECCKSRLYRLIISLTTRIPWEHSWLACCMTTPLHAGMEEYELLCQYAHVVVVAFKASRKLLPG